MLRVQRLAGNLLARVPVKAFAGGKVLSREIEEFSSGNSNATSTCRDIYLLWIVDGDTA
jgi:hypothetical protein